MRRAEYETLRAMEDHYWWYGVLRWLVLRELLKRCPERARLLDAGCGTGGMLSAVSALRPMWELHGIDLEPMAVEHCHERRLMNVIHGNVARLPFEDGSFEAVICLDVLYHASVNQAAALAEFERVLQPGGLLVLNVPAFEALRGSHDVAVCGARRYIACHVHEWLRRHNLEAEMIHYWNAWLFLPLCIWRRFSRTSSCRSLGFEGSDLTPLPSLFNTIAGLVSRWDACFCRWTRLPFGTSIFALATKPHHGRSNED